MSNSSLVSISSEIIEFVRGNIESIGKSDLVPILIEFRFPDEDKNNLRISLQEKEEFDDNNKGKGTFVEVDGIPNIFIPAKLEDTVKGKRMVLVGDIIELI